MELPLTTGEKTAGVMVRVLLADDNAPFRNALRRLLERDPAITVVAEAEDGAQAIELAETHGPDVILMDVSMPRLDGLAATQQLRHRRPTIAVVLLSVGSTAAEVAAGLDGGASAYLVKGTSAEDIAEAIKQFGPATANSEH